MSVPAIAVEHVKEHPEPESKLSEEELKVLAEIRNAKYKAFERIKVRVTRAVGGVVRSNPWGSAAMSLACTGAPETNSGH